MFIFSLISMCAADIIYYKPINILDDGYPIYSKFPKYYYGPYKGEVKHGLGEELKDYWGVFAETFKKSYKELNKPYIVERPVPVPGKRKQTIPKIQFRFLLFSFFSLLSVPIERVRTRTIVKEHPVFIKPRPKIVYRKIKYSKLP